MDEKLMQLIESNVNLEDYLNEYGDNSIFLYNYYMQDANRILKNYYIYEHYLNVTDKIKLFYRLLDNNTNLSIINTLLRYIVIYKHDDKYQNEINDLLKYLLNLGKENKIDLDNIDVKQEIYSLDPVYFVEKDFTNIKYLAYNLNKDIILNILQISVQKKHQFSQNDELFVKVRVLDDIETLIYFINNCSFDNYIVGLITDYLDKLDNNMAFDIYNKIDNKNLKNFLATNLNFDNFDVNTVVKDENIYLIVDNRYDEALKFLHEIKERNFDNNIILIMNRVDLQFIDQAHNIYGDKIRISPMMNQEHKKAYDEVWNYKSYTVDEIKKSETTLNLYTNTVNDKVDKDGDIKALSPLEKYVAAYILTTKFAPYTKEDDELKEYHTSRSVYEFMDKITNRKIVCTGYVHLLREFLYRMGLTDTIRWDVHSKSEEMNNHTFGDNHTRMIIHLTDPKYDIDGIYMADPTWDEDFGNFKHKHMLMSRYEIQNADPEFTDDDLHLNETYKIGEELGVSNVHELFNRPIPQESIIKAYLAVEHFLDKNMKMIKNDEEYDILVIWHQDLAIVIF